MRLPPSLICVLLAAQTALAEPIGAANVPKDLRAVLDRAEGCEHWAGEDAYNEERGQEIKAALERLKCAQLSADIARLRKKYAKKPKILALLAKLES